MTNVRSLTGFRVHLLTALIVFTVVLPSSAAEHKPNVLFILTDDQGTIDVNCYGAKDLVTPNMDALAKRGIRFTNFYAGAPVCAPSRASCMTGRNPHRAGVPGNAGTSRGAPGGLAPEQVTMAEVLKAAGYATAHIGKWHLGYQPHVYPNNQGFDYSFGHMGGCIDNYSHFYYWNGPNQHDLWRNGEEVYEDGKFFGDLMVREATEFMDKNRDRPFFMYFAINMPHYPYQGDNKWLTYYREKKTPYPRDLYAAFVSTIDERIGRLVAKIDELGLSEDTIVILQSDHGHSVEIRAHGGGGNAGPHRGHKFELLEGGIRVPAMISYPGKIPAGEVRHQPAIAWDWLPTVATLCGAKLPDYTIDGKDIAPILASADAPSPHEYLFWQQGNQFAVRKGAWKLIAEKGTPALYNLQDDPGEATDLTTQRPELAEELLQRFKAWNKTKTESVLGE